MIENILNRLDKVKPNGSNKWSACCPSHDDKGPSLSIRDTGEKILFHCFAGCDTSDVLAAIGLEWKDILPPSSPGERRSHARTVQQAGLRRTLWHERLILEIAEANTSWTAEDMARVRLARERIAKIEVALHE